MKRTEKIKQQVYLDLSEKNSLNQKQIESLQSVPQRCTRHNCKEGPIITDTSSGEIICGSCGFVLAEKSIDPTPEHISDVTEFAAKTRTGPEQSLAMYDMGMMTVMSDKDAMGNSLSGYMKESFSRLKMLNSRSRTAASNRTLRSALLLLYSLKTKLGLPDSVAENAAYIYRKAMQKKITVGRSAKGLMCASLYIACRQNEIPRSLVDVSQAGNLGKKEVSRACRNLLERLEITLEPSGASEFINKIATQAGVTEKTRRDALKILGQLTQNGSSAGKNPMALAATTLYLACVLNNERKTQFEIARASGITTVTIRNRYSSLRKELGLEKGEN